MRRAMLGVCVLAFACGGAVEIDERLRSEEGATGSVDADAVAESAFIGAWTLSQRSAWTYFGRVGRISLERGGRLVLEPIEPTQSHPWGSHGPGVFRFTDAYAPSVSFVSKTCRLGNRWRPSGERRIAIAGVCDDGIEREIELTWPAIGPSANPAWADVAVLTIGGEPAGRDACKGDSGLDGCWLPEELVVRR